jgi:hypothetical protein
MGEEPENMIHVLLRDIRAKQDELSIRLEAVETRVGRIESQYDDLRMTVTYALGQSTDIQFKQAKQGARIDELFAQLEKLLTAKKRGYEIPPHLLAGSIGKRSIEAVG